MSLGLSRNDFYRLATQQIVPAPPTKRQKCDCCLRYCSIGQFPINSSTCVRCNPQGKNFRRGEI